MSTPVQPSVLASARSFLFVPGHRPERFGKALASGADAVILDLEDAVPLTSKDDARTAIAMAWTNLTGSERARLLVRINPVGTPWHAQDLALLQQLVGLGAVMLPKAESSRAIADIAQVCPGLPVLPLLESAEGFAQLDDIARAPQVLRMGLGHIDLQADIGMACGPDEAELAPARWALVTVTRRARLAPAVDGVTTATGDEHAVLRDTQRSRRFGFGAKLCIHPSQIASVHQGFSPTDAEQDWAQRVLAAEAHAGGGAFSVDGKMVDAPVLALARQWLARVAKPA